MLELFEFCSHARKGISPLLHQVCRALPRLHFFQLLAKARFEFQALHVFSNQLGFCGRSRVLSNLLLFTGYSVHSAHDKVEEDTLLAVEHLFTSVLTLLLGVLSTIHSHLISRSTPHRSVDVARGKRGTGDMGCPWSTDRGPQISSHVTAEESPWMALMT